MKQRKLIAVLMLVSLIAIAAPSLARNRRNERNGNDTRFNVRIENISMKDGFTASNGTKFSVALSPGLWVTHELEVRLYKEGVAARKVLEESRKKVGEFIHAHADEIVFTSGGTEANGLALEGAARAAFRNGSRSTASRSRARSRLGRSAPSCLPRSTSRW